MSQRPLEGTMRITIPPISKGDTAQIKPGIALPKSSISVFKKPTGEDSPYQEVLRSLYDGVLITDFGGKIKYANVRAVDFLKYERTVLYQLSVFNIISGADETLMKTINENLENQRFTYIEAYCQRSDESIFPAEIAVNKLEDPSKGQLCFFVRDITKRKQAEEELHQSVEKTRELLSATPDLMFRISREGIFLDYKAATEGPSENPDQFIGKKIQEVLPSLAQEIWSRIEGALKQGGVHQFEYVLSENGSDRHYEARIVPKGTEEVFTIIRDITERKEAEEALQKNKQELEQNYQSILEKQLDAVKFQRAALIRTLLDGLNHEIGNPLALLSNQFVTLNKHASTLKRLLTHYEVFSELTKGGNEIKRSEVLKRIEEMRQKENISHALEEMEQIFTESRKEIRRLKDFSDHFKYFSNENGTASKVDVNRCVEATLDLFQGNFNSKCSVIKKLEDVPSLKISAMELSQVIMNLLLNAANAILSQGEIVIRTRSDGESVLIHISDNGVGIPSEKLSRLINSWVTAKISEEGKGLGLPMCFSIIQQHKGTIDIQSQPDHGTTVTLRLPAHA